MKILLCLPLIFFLFTLEAAERKQYDPIRGCIDSKNGASGLNTMDSGYCDDCHHFECCAGHMDPKKTNKIFDSCNKHLSDYQKPAGRDALNLRGSSLQKVDLSLANLNGADMEGANLDQANMSGSNLRGANLTRAKMHGTNFSQAHLDYANFYEATLKDVNFQSTYVDHLNLMMAARENSPLSARQESHVIFDAADLCEKLQDLDKREKKLSVNDHGERQSILAMRTGLNWGLTEYNKKSDKIAAPGNAVCKALITRKKEESISHEMESLLSEMKREVELETEGAYSVDSTKMAHTIFGIVSGTFPLVGIIVPLPGPSAEVKAKLQTSSVARHEQRMLQISNRYEKKRDQLRMKLNRLSLENSAEVNDSGRLEERTRGSASESGNPTPTPASGTRSL